MTITLDHCHKYTIVYETNCAQFINYLVTPWTMYKFRKQQT